MTYSFEKDIRANALLYAAALCLVGGAMYHYPRVFALKAAQQEKQSIANESANWACAAIEGKHPLLVDQNGTPLTLKDGSKYYGASQLGAELSPLPAGSVLRDATGATGMMRMGATGETVFDYVGSCPSLAGTAGVTTMGTEYKGSGK